MPRRGENIRKRKDGRWEARYPNGRNKSGKTAYGSVYGNTYKEVKEKRRMIVQESCAKTEQSSGGITFRELLNRWEADNRIRLKESTVYRYRYLIDTHILPDLGDKLITEITSPVINAFLTEKSQNGRLDGKGGLSAAYVRSIMLVIHSALRLGVAEGLCSPLRTKVNKPPILSKELNVLSKEHQTTLENELLSNMNETKLGIYISLYTGLRIGEICALAWKDIDLKYNLIHVRHTVVRIRSEDNNIPGTSLKIDQPKTPSSLRCIPICSSLQHVLREYAAKAVSEYVVSEGSGFVSPRTFEYRYHKILKENHIPSINFHGLRHTFATRCIEAGVDVKSLSEVLGHANVAITLNTYVHSSMELKRTQLEKLVCHTV